MPEVHVSADRTIDASPDRVYNCIADYQDHHPHFLPPAFSDYKVEEGGVGAGTIVSFVLTAGSRRRAYRMKVEEPEPGRILTESDLGSTLVTTFRVSPDGTGSRVQIETRWQGASGFGGVMERFFAPRALSRLYADELNRLADYVRSLA
jgi:hypothetical protein